MHKRLYNAVSVPILLYKLSDFLSSTFLINAKNREKSQLWGNQVHNQYQGKFKSELVQRVDCLRKAACLISGMKKKKKKEKSMPATNCSVHRSL